ncbi:MAG: hypothetical protein LQ351_000039 [Letrouitia transgressa]|nr:MAG: hypothetical protein LQ351_000039 [Letrouitia transgressa]
MAPFLLQFIKHQFTSLPYPDKSAQGQTVVVTGANVGLGLEAARHFTRLGAARVILGVRSLEKGEAAKASIEKTTGRKHVVEVWQVDLGSFESVKEFSRKIHSLDRLDILVENAGIARYRWVIEEDNESTITINVVSTFLMALLVLPKLKETAARFNVTPHLTIVSSDVHFVAKFAERKSADIFAALNDKETADMKDRYNVSKILEVFYTRELAQRVDHSKQSGVIINFVNPGLCHSELAREAGIGLYLLKLFFARTTEVGSRNYLWAAQGDWDTHGQYVSSCRVYPPASLVRSKDGEETQYKVWKQLSDKLEKIHPGIMSNVST